jgi:16S rRNA (guanine1207-N2)-methyltransferase
VSGDTFNMTDHYFTAEPSSKMKLGLLNVTLLGKGLKFLTSTGVFSYRRVDTGTRVLVGLMKIPEEGYILDLGCGWGAIGILVATIHPEVHVVMSDINKRAVWLASQNVKLNKVSADVRCGNLYEPTKSLKFATILTNPPISAGRNLIVEAINGAHDHLCDGGTLQLVARTTKGSRTISKIMEKVFHNVDEVGKKSGYRVYSSYKNAGSTEVPSDKRL